MIRLLDGSANEGLATLSQILKRGQLTLGQLWTSLFFRPTPCGFRQVVQQLSKPVANDINYLIRTGANAVVAAKVNWKRTDT